MKIKHIWSVLCRESVINQDDNLISLISVLEELGVTTKLADRPDKISIPVNYEIVSLWLKNNKKSVKASVKYSLVDPDGKELIQTTQDIEISPNIRRYRTRMKISGIPVTKAGDYYFTVRIREEGVKTFYLVSELPLEVRISPEDQQTN